MAYGMHVDNDGDLVTGFRDLDWIDKEEIIEAYEKAGYEITITKKEQDAL